MARGPTGQQQQQDIELTLMDSTVELQQPLLQGQQGYFEQRPRFQQQSSGTPSEPPSLYFNNPDVMREAPMHRPHLAQQRSSSYGRPAGS